MPHIVRIVYGATLCVLLMGCSRSLDGHPVTDSQQPPVTSNSTSSGMNAAPILLFRGKGTSLNDVAAIEAILKQNHLAYAQVGSEQLNAMNRAQIRTYQLLIVPGGNFIEMGNSLTAETTARIHDAVKSGLNYLGICAGAFLAGSYPAPYRSFDLTAGVKFGWYSAERHGIRKASLRITTADGTALDQYWEDGPELSGWGDAVAEYPDGTPAVAEGFAGGGWVILVGIHAEAPDTWRGGLSFSTPATASNAYAETLIDAALNRKQLPHM